VNFATNLIAVFPKNALIIGSAVDRTLVVSLGCHLNAGTITEKTQKEMPKCPNAQIVGTLLSSAVCHVLDEVSLGCGVTRLRSSMIETRMQFATIER
jgi:hypothetical protein